MLVTVTPPPIPRGAPYTPRHCTTQRRRRGARSRRLLAGRASVGRRATSYDRVGDGSRRSARNASRNERGARGNGRRCLRSGVRGGASMTIVEAMDYALEVVRPRTNTPA
jgi:hypothetical protein